ncbi:MAG: hypothetical protein ACXWJZ_18035 [Burkholderiaceae bacterium]
MTRLRFTDPDHVPETFCNGPVNLTVTGAIGTLTLVHLRKSAAGTFGDLDPETADAVIRARLVLPIEAIVELRNLLDGMISKQQQSAPGSSARN